MRNPVYRLNVGIITMEADPWELEKNFERLEKYTREAVNRRADLVIAPEAILDGYAYGADPEAEFKDLVSIAQKIPDGQYLQKGSNLAKELKIYFIFGFLQISNNKLYNSVVMFDPEGEIVSTYSKVHPKNESFITPGEELKVTDTPFGKIGFLICSDRGVTDNFSTLGVQGVQIIFLPMDGAGGTENIDALRYKAMDNHCWIVVANTWSCALISPQGEIISQRYECECVTLQRIDVHSHLAEETETQVPNESSSDSISEPRRKFLARRPDLYKPLIESPGENAYFDSQGEPTEKEIKSRKSWKNSLRKKKR